MGKVIKIFGPPGTGKTTSIVSLLKKLIARKEIREKSVYAVSLTKATKYAFLKKCRDEGIEIPPANVRTLHSFAYKKLKEEGEKVKLIKAEELKEFFREKGFEFEIGELDEENSYSQSEYSDLPGNRAFAGFQKLRLTYDPSTPFSEHYKKFFLQENEELGFTIKDFYKLFYDYIHFLKENQKYDFTQFLIEAWRRGGIPLKGDVLILDEFQDFGHLHFALIRQMIDQFKYVIVAGDDDQAIFGFAGSDYRIIKNMKADEVRILETSYRLPEKIYDLAQSIITHVKDRVSKRFSPSPQNGAGKIQIIHDVWDGLRDLNGKSLMILARNKYFIDYFCKIFDSADIPYAVIGKNKTPGFVWKLKTLQKLKERKEVSRTEVEELINEIKPFIRKIANKKQIRKEFFEKIVDAVIERKFSSMYEDLAQEVAYYIYHKDEEALFGHVDRESLKKWRGRFSTLESWKNPQIQLSTIHGAKGLEADKVILLTAMTYRTKKSLMRDIDQERRVWYVAVTRAKQELFILYTHIFSKYFCPFL